MVLVLKPLSQENLVVTLPYKQESERLSLQTLGKEVGSLEVTQTVELKSAIFSENSI